MKNIKIKTILVPALVLVVTSFSPVFALNEGPYLWVGNRRLDAEVLSETEKSYLRETSRRENML